MLRTMSCWFDLTIHFSNCATIYYEEIWWMKAANQCNDICNNYVFLLKDFMKNFNLNPKFS